MPHQHRTAITSHKPPMADAGIDTLLIDDEDDDFLDRYLADFASRWPTSAAFRTKAAMTNTNCLTDIQRPACGNEDRFRITATAVSPSLTTAPTITPRVEWDDDQPAECADCLRTAP